MLADNRLPGPLAAFGRQLQVAVGAPDQAAALGAAHHLRGEGRLPAHVVVQVLDPVLLLCLGTALVVFGNRGWLTGSTAGAAAW